MSLPRKQYTAVGPTSYAQNIQSSVVTPNTGDALRLGSYRLANRSGAALDVGLFWRQPNGYFTAGKVVAASTPDYTDNTTNAKSTVANAFVNIFSTTNNDGFLVSSPVKFNAISFTVGAGSSGEVIAPTYYDGTNMTVLPTIQNAITTSAGHRFIVFNSPSDWVVNTTTAVGGPANVYSICIRASTAPGGAVSGSDFRVYSMIDMYPQLASNAEITNDFSGNEFVLPKGASVVPFFGNTASNANSVWVTYRAVSFSNS